MRVSGVATLAEMRRHLVINWSWVSPSTFMLVLQKNVRYFSKHLYYPWKIRSGIYF
jgi:putative NADH-flavin reductase